MEYCIVHLIYQGQGHSVGRLSHGFIFCSAGIRSRTSGGTPYSDECLSWKLLSLRGTQPQHFSACAQRVRLSTRLSCPVICPLLNLSKNNFGKYVFAQVELCR